MATDAVREYAVLLSSHSAATGGALEPLETYTEAMTNGEVMQDLDDSLRFCIMTRKNTAGWTSYPGGLNIEEALDAMKKWR